MRMNRCVLIVLGVFLATYSTSQSSNFERGLKAVVDSNYSKAIEIFAKDYEEQPSVATTFNLGVVHLRRNDYKRALFAFERGLMKAPYDTDLKVNARYAFRKVNPKETWSHPVPALIRLLYVLPFYGWLSLAVLFSLISAFAVYGIFAHRKETSWHSWSHRLVIPGIGLLLIVLVILITLSNFHNRDHYGFVNTEQELYLHPDGMKTSLQIPAGKVNILHYNGDSTWVKVRFSNHQGWVAKNVLNTY